MKEPLRFRRSPDLEQRVFVLEHCFDVRLTKGDRTRRYWIRPGQTAGEWFGQVWFSDQTQHRGDVTTDFHRVQQLKAEYFREIDELECDGWTITAGPDPRPAKECGHLWTPWKNASHGSKLNSKG